jgi:hypothetical protein
MGIFKAGVCVLTYDRLSHDQSAASGTFGELSHGTKPSLKPRKVEGLDGITTARSRSGRGSYQARPSGETRSHPESLEKRLVHSDNHGISVPDQHVHEKPIAVGQDMKRGWHVKPLLAPKKVEGRKDGITKDRNGGKGQRKALKANLSSKELHQEIHAPCRPQIPSRKLGEGSTGSLR